MSDIVEYIHGLCVMTSSATNLMDVYGFPGLGQRLLNEAIK